MYSSRTTQSTLQRQRGAAFMVMLVIMIIGVATMFVASLSSSAIQIARDRTTADALAKAKEALIGYAVKDSTRPGELPCPDVNDDGMLTIGTDLIGSNCASPIGRLPWKTLGLSELHDGAGEHLWYTVSKTFWANGGTPINSNSIGNLTVNGTTAANNVIAIVFAAGAPVSGQSRSSTNQAACSTNASTIYESWCATNYLEGTNPAPSPQATPNLNYQSADTSSTFNDHLMIISAGDIIPIVEMRVAKELTTAFAAYFAANGNKYPYPANFTTTCTPGSSASCPSDPTQCIGKVPATPMNLYTILPWFTDNKWFDVIYYTAGTASLPSGLGGGGGGAGIKGKGKGKGGGGGGGSGGGSTICPTNHTSILTVLNPDGTTLTPTASALFLMPDTPVGIYTGITRIPMSTTNLPSYFEDFENQNLDNAYIMPTNFSNDSLYILP